MPSVASNYGQTPLTFELNVGQSASSVLALAHGSGFGFFLTNNDSMVFSVPHRDAQSGALTGQDDFTLQLTGANSQAKVQSSDVQPGISNYFLGAGSPEIADVAQYGQLTEQNIYPGIDLVLHSSSQDSQNIEYDFVVNPVASAASIQMDAEGLQNMQLDDQGRLILGTSGGNVVMSSPQFYQTVNGQQQAVSGQYVLGGNNTIGFEATGSYDPSLPLVIDPTIGFSSYLGDSGINIASAVSVDAAGESYVTGQTTATDFPTQNGYQSSAVSGTNAFITKFNAQGTGVVYSTYLGDPTGAGNSVATGIAVDLAGDAYVVGTTAGTYFPTTTGAYQTTFSGRRPVSSASSTRQATNCCIPRFSAAPARRSAALRSTRMDRPTSWGRPTARRRCRRRRERCKAALAAARRMRSWAN